MNGIPNKAQFTLEEWLGKHWAGLTAVISLTTINVIVGLLPKLGIVKEFITSDWFETSWIGFHCVCILFFFAFTMRGKPQPIEQCPEASRRVTEFYYFVLALWLSWFMFYFFVIMQSFDATQLRINDPNPDNPENAAALTDRVMRMNYLLSVFNNGQSVCFLLCFWALGPRRTYDSIFVIVFSAFAVSAVPIFFEGIWPRLTDLSSGFFAGLSLALFVGRLDSRYLKLPFWCIALLYSYAILQTSWHIFSKLEGQMTVISTLALIMKLNFFLALTWLMSSKRLLFYFNEQLYLSGELELEKKDPLSGVAKLDDRYELFLETINEKSE